MSTTDKYFTIPGVAVFDEHESSKAKPPFDRVDRGLLEEIARNSQRRIDDTGDLCPITLGHTRSKSQISSGGNSSTDQPPVVGYAKNFRVGTIGKLNPRAAIIADFDILESAREDVKSYRRRSIEVWPEDKIIDPIALLSAETPRRDLGLLTYERYRPAHADSQYGRERIRYSMDSVPDSEENTEEQERKPAMQDFQEFMDTFMATPVGMFITSQMEAAKAAAAPNPATVPAPVVDSPLDQNADTSAAPPADPNADAPPPAKSGNGDDNPGGNDNPDDKLTDEEKEKLRMSRDQDAIRFRKLEDQVSSLTSRLAESEKKVETFSRKARNSDREKQLIQLEAEGYKFSRADELSEMQDATDEQWGRHVDRIRQHYQRGPADVRIYSRDIPDGGHTDKPKGIEGREHSERVVKYMRDHKCSQEVARAAVLAEAN